MSQRLSFIYFCWAVLEGSARGGSGRPLAGGIDVREGSCGDGLALGGGAFGGPTGTMRDPNSTPIVTSWWGEKRPSQRRIVRDDLPVPLSPMHTSFAMKSQEGDAISLVEASVFGMTVHSETRRSGIGRISKSQVSPRGRENETLMRMAGYKCGLG